MTKTCPDCHAEVLSTSQIAAWECMGRKQSLPEPGECNWPDCGCDPHATKVIESLLEQGWTGPSALAATPAVGGEITDAMINSAAREMWNDRDARHGGSWDERDPREVCVIQTKATAKAALKAALAAQPASPLRGREISVHLSHCNQGEYLGSCKYGDDDCPAIRSTVPTPSVPAQLAPDTAHYLNAIRVRLETLYASAEDNPRLREQLSDEVDWIDAQMEQPAAAQVTARPQPAIDNLTNHQEQCDMDGVMVKVSRQALDEVLAFVSLTAPDKETQA